MNLRAALIAFAALLVLLPSAGWAGRCATGTRAYGGTRAAPLRPVARQVAARSVAPVPTSGANVHTTEHFRVLWGDGYNRADPDWADPDGDGLPTWVETLATALEEALAVQTALGFPQPYGSERYYLDAYVGNTGVMADGYRVTISSNYYAYTEIDDDFAVAYFVFNSDFSSHTADELGVLRATAAHELFHAVQRNDYPWDDEVQIPDSVWWREGWWFESTATWVEELCQPEVDDYASYVRDFLARPEDPLQSMDGSREYGAAVFAGFVWLHRGGVDTWRTAFSTAQADGLEAALDASLRAFDGVGLEHSLAWFWSLAGHPEDGWPDGALYRSAGTPKVYRSASVLPLDLTPTAQEGPARFGANLVTLDLPAAAPRVGLLEADSGSAWLVALSAEGEVGARVELLEVGAAPVVFPTTGPAHLALVNVSPSTGYRQYRAVVDGDRVEGGAAADESSSSGCFVSVLGSGPPR